MNIKQYSTEKFRKQFTYADESLDQLFRDDYVFYFCIEVEKVIPFAKTPIPPVKEQSHSIIYIAGGVFEITKGNKHFVIKKGEGIAIPAGEVFSIDSISKDLKGYSLHFLPELLMSGESVVELLPKFDFLVPYSNVIFRPRPNDSSLEYLLKRVNGIYTRSGYEKRTLVQSYILTILAECDNCKSNAPVGTAQYQLITNKFKSLLFNHFKIERRTTFYSGKLGITPNHLNKVLKETTGKSTSEWINEAIILESKFLLSQTTMRISEVAFAVGVEDPSYFTRLFKKSEHLTPIDYRDKMIEKS
ncbi:AraC family transcriptional regulator [Ulvibacterium sp.]|uniref:helix-turn-helix domain-containing protein n=1 Tax=Ulvibacterium sp. TaxID=2665914 RepID=UPI00260197BF|nr:helix-turn-helix domain-containing protein [Ulvibacterium sp.]